MPAPLRLLLLSPVPVFASGPQKRVVRRIAEAGGLGAFLTGGDADDHDDFLRMPKGR